MAARRECLPGGGKQPGAIGSLSNPGSTVWEDVVADLHPYKGVPHTAQIIRDLGLQNDLQQQITKFFAHIGKVTRINCSNRLVRLFE